MDTHRGATSKQQEEEEEGADTPKGATSKGQESEGKWTLIKAPTATQDRVKKREWTLTRTLASSKGQGEEEGMDTHKGATSSKGLGAQASQRRGLVLHGVIFFPVLSGLGQGHNEELLPQGVLHLLVVGGLVEVAGEQFGQQLLQDIGKQEQQPTEPHSAR